MSVHKPKLCKIHTCTACISMLCVSEYLYIYFMEPQLHQDFVRICEKYINK